MTTHAYGLATTFARSLLRAGGGQAVTDVTPAFASDPKRIRAVAKLGERALAGWASRCRRNQSLAQQAGHQEAVEAYGRIADLIANATALARKQVRRENEKQGDSDERT